MSRIRVLPARSPQLSGGRGKTTVRTPTPTIRAPLPCPSERTITGFAAAARGAVVVSVGMRATVLGCVGSSSAVRSSKAGALPLAPERSETRL